MVLPSFRFLVSLARAIVRPITWWRVVILWYVEILPTYAIDLGALPVKFALGFVALRRLA